jgi:hypothetical protein
MSELELLKPAAIRDWLLKGSNREDLATLALRGRHPKRKTAVGTLYHGLSAAHSDPAFVPEIQSQADPSAQQLWTRGLKLPIANTTKQVWWFYMAHCLPSGSHIRHFCPLQDTICVMCSNQATEDDHYWMYGCEVATSLWRNVNRVLQAMGLRPLTRDMIMRASGIQDAFPDYALDFVLIAICEACHALYQFRNAIKWRRMDPRPAQHNNAVLLAMLKEYWTMDLRVAARRKKELGDDRLHQCCQKMTVGITAYGFDGGLSQSLRSATVDQSQ